MIRYLGIGCLVAASLYITRCYFVGKKCTCSKLYVNGEFIIVTGASSGIGKATATELAHRGARVILACRDLEKARKVRNKIIYNSSNINVNVLHLDLASFKSIHEFVRNVSEILSGHPLAALVNNAGLFYADPQLTEDGYDLTFQTNYLGPFLLTHLLLPLLEKSPESRIVNISSAAHLSAPLVPVEQLIKIDKDSYHKFNAYKFSKLSLVAFSSKLYSLLESKKSPVRVFAVDPGNVETAIFRNFPPLSVPIFYWLQKPLRLILVKTPLEGAQSVLHALLSPNLRSFYIKNVAESLKYSELVKDDVFCETLLKESKIWVKL